MAVPPDTPLMIPLVILTDATAGCPLTHVPPPVIWFTIVVFPWQTTGVDGVIGNTLLTESVFWALQPFDSVYVMVAVPVLPPVAIPVEDTIAAIPLLLLVQEPPASGLVNVVVIPGHISGMPTMARGNGLTVTPIVVAHPVARRYVMVVLPVVTGLTIPENTLILAILVDDEPQVPPPELLKVMVLPRQTMLGPLIAFGLAKIDTGAVTWQPVPLRA